MNLSDLTNKDLIILNSSLKHKKDIIRALVKQLYANGKITSEEEFLQAVFDRESLSETGMEAGLAIPHGKSNSVKEAAFAVMSTKDVVEDWESIDPTNRVKYIFLLAIPEDQAGTTHLELLAELVQRMSDEKYKEKLFASRSVDEFYKNLDNKKEESAEPVKYDKSIVAVTACPAGIAHTYMSAEALVKAGKEMGVKVYVEKQGANGIAPVHGVEQIAHLGVFPNKRTLDFWQSQNARINIGYERLQRVGNLCEEGHERSGYVVGRGPRPRTASIRRAGAL